MKVYLTPPKVASPSLMRVTNALIKYKPKNVEIVDSEKDADLVILHVIGRQEQTTKHASKLKNYAVIQYAIRSTLSPKTNSWLPLWNKSKLVWSYYDLFSLCEEDGVTPAFDFYHSPLGVDPVFRKKEVEKKSFLIATSGQSFLTESVKECVNAAKPCAVFHLGNELNIPGVFCRTNISDEQLCDYYNNCHFVSGLRRVEGFELPAAEGLMCGAMPIMFDRPHYRKWFDGIANFIPEGTRSEVQESIERVFAYGESKVNDVQIQVARERFNWETIISNFWKKVL